VGAGVAACHAQDAAPAWDYRSLNGARCARVAKTRACGRITGTGATRLPVLQSRAPSGRRCAREESVTIPFVLNGDIERFGMRLSSASRASGAMRHVWTWRAWPSCFRGTWSRTWTPAPASSACLDAQLAMIASSTTRCAQHHWSHIGLRHARTATGLGARLAAETVGVVRTKLKGASGGCCDG